MNEERIAQLVVEFLLAEAGGMVKSSDDNTSGEGASAGEGGGSKKASSKGGGNVPLADVFKQFETKLFALLAPAALVATMLSSAASGMSVFIGAIKLVGNTLGMMLAPGILLASAVILSLNEMIQGALLGSLEDWYTAIIDGGIKAIDWLGEAIAQVVNGMNAWETAMFKGISGLSEAVAFLASSFAAIIRVLSKSLALDRLSPLGGADANRKAAGLDRMADRFNLAADIQRGLAPQTRVWDSVLGKLGLMKGDDGKYNIPGVTGFGDRVTQNLGKVLTQFRFDNAPKSQSTSIAAANMAAQSASFNMSPFERENLKIIQTIADTMGRVLTKISPPTTS